MVRSQFED
jgi:hypothetical protein